MRSAMPCPHTLPQLHVAFFFFFSTLARYVAAYIRSFDDAALQRLFIRQLELLFIAADITLLPICCCYAFSAYAAAAFDATDVYDAFAITPLMIFAISPICLRHIRHNTLLAAFRAMLRATLHTLLLFDEATVDDFLPLIAAEGLYYAATPPRLR